MAFLNTKDEWIADGKIVGHWLQEDIMNNEHVTLSLLLIDLGKSTVVKVEKLGAVWQRVPVSGLFRISKDADMVCYCHEGESDLVYAPFTEIRAAIDRLTEGEPPMLRIEHCKQKTAITGQPTYYVHHSGDGQVLWISQTEYDALSALAGKPLPIWTPSKGVWVKLSPTDVDEAEIANEVDMPYRDVKRVLDATALRFQTPTEGLEIWRFTIE